MKITPCWLLLTNSPQNCHSSILLLQQGKVYIYDKVLKPNVTQEQVYNEVAKPIVKGMVALCLSLAWASPQSSSTSRY